MMPNVIDLSDGSVNVCRLTRQFILHLQFVKECDDRNGLPGRVINMNDCINLWDNNPKRMAVTQRSRTINNTHLLAMLPENLNPAYYYANIGKDIFKLILYYLLRDCLIEWMDKRATIKLDEVLDKKTMRTLREKLKNPQNRELIIEYFTVYDNIQERYRNLLINRKIPFKKPSDPMFFDGSTIIEHLTLLSFETMNNKERKKLMEYYLESIYKKNLNISDEMRNEYYNQINRQSIEGIQTVEKTESIEFEFDTLNLERNVWKMKNNIVNVPKFPCIEISQVSHTRPSNLRLFKLPFIGKMDDWCLSNICGNGNLFLLGISGILCCWCSTGLCCYKVSFFLI